MTIAAAGVSSEVRLQIDDLIDERGQVIENVLADPQLAQTGPIDPTIAPFLVDEPPSPASTTYLPAPEHQRSPSHSFASSKGFSKSSLTSFLSFRQNSSASRSFRTSDSTAHVPSPDSKHRSSYDDCDTATVNSSTTQQTELRKKSSMFNIGLLKRKASKAHLRHGSQEDSPPPPVPPKPADNFVFNLPVDPPHPFVQLPSSLHRPSNSKDKGKGKEKDREREQERDREREREREREKDRDRDRDRDRDKDRDKEKEKSREKEKEKRSKKRRIKGPPVPPKDNPLFSLDTNLDRMEGIVSAENLIPLTNHAPENSLTDPPTFNNPFSSSDPQTGAINYGPSHISPTASMPFLNGQTPDLKNARPSVSTIRKDDGEWVTPQSWIVVGKDDTKDDMTAPDDDVSTEDETRAKSGPNSIIQSNGLHPPSFRMGGSIKPSRRDKTRKGNDELVMKIYRPNGIPIQTAMGISLTVYDLIPTLLKRMVGDERRLNRLFLMERGKERIMDIRELPLNLICRRMTEAGYSWNDGRILLSGDRLAFLLKFIFRDPDMGLSRRSITADALYQIPESELRLHNFESLDLSGRSLRTIPVALHQHADQIVSLKLSRNPMIDLPLDFVEACTSLSDLRLSDMSMRKIPANLVAAKALKRLDLSSNHIKIKELESANLQLIPELKALLLQNNLLKDLPQKFADFEDLRFLNISSNRLPAIPDVVLQIRTLTELDVSFNYITALPTNVGDMTSLQRFLFVGNSIKSIPNSFWKLRNLEHVDCRRNQIGDLGIVMNLPRLETLNADHNSIHLLDLSMGKHVMKIDLSNNEITKVMVSLPPFGSTSSQLTTLDVSYASLTTLDGAVLNNLPTLVTLRIQHNSLAYLPDSIEELVHLETLICYENRLQRLPDTIGNLLKLITLDAHSNNLREVPVAIWQCPSLCILNLSSNFLTTFPVPPLIPLYPMPDQTGRIADPPKNYNPSHVISSILHPPLMFSLENLSISENKISSIDGLRNISFIRSLLSLNLSYNDISNLPKGFFRKMHRLEEFHICGNELTMIPGHEEFSNLRELKRLFLSGNKLTSLPAELGRLKKLKVMDVSNNCLRYNINNYGYDWNWNNNEELFYLNLSGNKRFQVKRDNRHTFGSSRSSRELHNPLSGFSSVPKLRILGLMDVTVTASDLPDEHEDRRVRSTSSLVGGLGYGIADSLNIDDSMTMLDLVHEFPPINGTSRALFAMFGNAKPPKLPLGVSPNKHAKFLHEHFIPFFQNQLDHPYLPESKHFAVDVLRRSFLGLHQTIHDMWFAPVQRKAPMASVAGGLPTVNVDSGTARTGCSGLVVYIEGNRLFAANVGSAHGVISRKGQPFLVTRIHCPWDEDELKRMRKSEGWVSPEGLVNDEVDVSRSFGYYQLLPVINASPDIVEYEISEADEYLVLGNRALWDFVSYQTAVDIASGRGEPSMIAQKLRDFAISYGSTGNIMVMVVRLKDYYERPLVRTPSMIESDSPFSPALYIPKSNHMVVDKSVRRAEPEVAPPIGHIALVFTDIRNSTHLWEVNPGMPVAIQIHNDLMRRRLRECGGYEFKTEGDAFLCSFPTIMAAVWFCLSVQNQLLQENWPKEILECEDGKAIMDSEGNVIWNGISVRMGIHSGTPVCLQDPVTHRMDYYGPVINRAARVSGLAKGGQIFCGAEVVQEIKASVLETIEKTSLSKLQHAKAIAEVKQLGVIIKEVGEMKLKGLEVPEFISAIYPPGLESRHDFDTEEDPAPASVYLDVAHVREIGMLCLRLEALTSGRIFKPSNTARDLNLTIPLEDDPEDEEDPELWRDLEVDPENVLPPMTTRWTDHDLLTTLDSFTCRIQNALQTLIKAYEADRINAPNIMNVLSNAGLDADTLLVIAELIGHS